jgi:hypothetical protein
MPGQHAEPERDKTTVKVGLEAGVARRQCVSREMVVGEVVEPD